jgi:hypothetical protein
MIGYVSNLSAGTNITSSQDFHESRFDFFLETYLQPTSFWNPNVIQDVLTETKVCFVLYVFLCAHKDLYKN